MSEDVLERSPPSTTSFVSLEEFDEENWNWGVLILRVVAIVLLVGIIIMFGLGAILPRLVILAGIVSVLLVVVLIASFFKCERLRSTWIFRYGGGGSNNRQGSMEIRNTSFRNPMGPQQYA